MADSKIQDNNYYQISGWMVTRLGLRGTALQVFAIIFGFSQDGESSFTGSLQYLMDFTNTGSKHTVIKALKELTDKEYITKTENVINGVQFNTYKVNAPVVQKMHWGSAENTPGGGAKTAPGGSAENAPNNKRTDNKGSDNKEIHKHIADMFNEICVSFGRVKVLSDSRVKAINASLKKFGEEDFRTVFEKAETNDFLKGKKSKGWKANFDWLIQTDNMVKVLEGNYDDTGGGNNGGDNGTPGTDSAGGDSGWGNVGLNF